MPRDTSDIDWHEYFYYDETSPSCLRWKINKYGGKGCVVKTAGQEAGYFCKIRFRWDVGLNNERYKVHRIIWEMYNGPIPNKMVVDHADGKASNNLIYNLRVVRQKVNMRNLKLRKDNLTGIVGVSRSSKVSRGKLYYYFTTSWVALNRKTRHKHFPIAKLGETQAFKLACEYRTLMIQQLNEQGAGYTERHGKT